MACLWMFIFRRLRKPTRSSTECPRSGVPPHPPPRCARAGGTLRFEIREAESRMPPGAHPDPQRNCQAHPSSVPRQLEKRPSTKKLKPKSTAQKPCKVSVRAASLRSPPRARDRLLPGPQCLEFRPKKVGVSHCNRLRACRLKSSGGGSSCVLHWVSKNV